MSNFSRVALIGFSVVAMADTVCYRNALAQMGNTSNSIGTAKIQNIQILKSIPKVKAKSVEGIQRRSVVTGGGYVHQAEMLLPDAPALDARDKLHDVVKHPYETLPSLQNSRLELIQ